MHKISIFNNIREVTNPKDENLIDHLEKIRDGEWEDIVTKCRLIKDKDERDLFKQTMPTVTFSGQFRRRSDDGLIEHSGIIAMDLDDVENINEVKQNIARDKHVVACFVSASGTGLRVLFRIDKTRHRDAFIGIKQYLYDQFNIISVDPNGKNVSKPYVVSYDPYAYINYEDHIPIFKKYQKETVYKEIPNFVHTDGDFKEVLAQIVGRGINICESYDDWLRVGFAIAEKFGPGGLEYFRAISQQDQKKIKVDDQYKYCLKAHGAQKVGISTFYYLAKTHGVNIVSEQTRKIIRTTKNGKKAGLKPDQIIANLLKFENISGADEVVKKVFEQRTDLDNEEESILHGLEMYIANNYSLRMNEVTGYLEQNGKSLLASDLNTIFISAKKLIPKLDYQLLKRLLMSDFIESYNPFFEFLGSDGIPVVLAPSPKQDEKVYDSPLIDKISESIINDNPAYTLTFTRKWLVSIISAMHKVHSPIMHCLVGAQLTGKTEWYRRLLPQQLRGYYAESKLDKGTDDELLMCENILIMDDEFSGKSKADTLKFNRITSCEYFSLRRPYGDHNEKVLRYGVLCGTSNYPSGIIADPTGNRRIVPITVDNINKELYNSIDKRELFLEAFRLYKQGFDWRINHFDLPYLNKDADKYEAVVKERELLLKYYLPGDETRMSTTEILVELELLTRQKVNIGALGRELEHLGFERRTTRVGQFQTVKKWLVIRNYKPIQVETPNKPESPQPNYF